MAEGWFLNNIWTKINWYGCMVLKGNNNKNDHKSGKYKKLLFSRRIGFMEMLASLFYSESCLCHCVLLIWVSENSFRSVSICAVSVTWRNVCVNKPHYQTRNQFLTIPTFSHPVFDNFRDVSDFCHLQQQHREMPGTLITMFMPSDIKVKTPAHLL